MFEKLLSFLRSKTDYYPFNYPAPEMEKQAAQYFQHRQNRLTNHMQYSEFNFEWGIEREEEALAVLVNTEILISAGKRPLLSQWLQYQPDEVTDLIEAYCEFNGYAI